MCWDALSAAPLREQFRSDLTTGAGAESFFKPPAGSVCFWTTLAVANDSINPSLSSLTRMAMWEPLHFI